MKKKIILGFLGFCGVMIVISFILQALGIVEPKETSTPAPTQQIIATEQPTQEPTEQPTVELTEEPTEQPKQELTEKEVVDIVSKIANENIGVDDTVESVTLKDKEFTIVLNLAEPPENSPVDFTHADFASTYTSSITDEILRHIELNQYWDDITFNYNGYGNLKNKTLKQSDAVGEGESRYFDIDFRDFE